MSVVCAALAALTTGLLLWSYVGYPNFIRRRAAASRPPERTGAPSASFEVLVAAADEESVIAERVRNLLAQEGPGRLTVRIGCDGCTDATAQRAREAGNGRVAIAEFPARRGKAAVLNDLVAASGAEVLVFTDANTRFDASAVRRLLEPFQDPSVGAVCGRLVLDAGSPVGSTESAFWDRETRVKDAEGRLGICLGANGAIYAIRRELFTPLPPDTTSMDDFLIPARIARGGRRVVFAGDAVAREEAGRDVVAEMARRFRIGVGAGQILRRETWLLDFRRHGLLALAFFSRKVSRWIAPLAGLAVLLAALAEPRLSVAAAGTLALLAALLLVAAARPRLGGILGALYYFVVINVALAAGVLAGLAGHRRPAWRRAR